MTQPIKPHRPLLREMVAAIKEHGAPILLTSAMLAALEALDQTGDGATTSALKTWVDEISSDNETHRLTKTLRATSDRQQAADAIRPNYPELADLILNGTVPFFVARECEVMIGRLNAMKLIVAALSDAFDAIWEAEINSMDADTVAKMHTVETHLSQLGALFNRPPEEPFMPTEPDGSAETSPEIAALTCCRCSDAGSKRYSCSAYAGCYCDKHWQTSGYRDANDTIDYLDAGETLGPEDYY